MPIILSEEDISKRLQQAYRPGALTGSELNLDLVPPEKLQCAAVLIPLAWFNEEWHVVLTRRTESVETHKGQVSFPGGGCHEGESTPEITALREAEEEIGLDPKDVRLLGRMNDMVTITGYRVTPVLGRIPWPYPLHLAPDEVARVFTIPLTWLTIRNHWKETPYTPNGSMRSFQVVTFEEYDGEVLWGATARIVLALLAILG